MMLYGTIAALTKAYANTKAANSSISVFTGKAYLTLPVRLAGQPDNRQPNGYTPMVGTMRALRLAGVRRPWLTAREARPMNVTMASEQAAQTGATAPAARVVTGVKVYGTGATAV